MKTEIIVLNLERNVTLTTYIQETEGEFIFKYRPGIVVLPGGGYAMCSDREADPVAMAYAKAGYQAFILRYTVGKNGGWPLPLEDYEQAMELIINRSEEWHIDKNKIAVAGFSAGGHLAACAATISKTKPAAAILIYPAILKEILDLCKPDLPSPNEFVTSETCPCFLSAARDDKTVNIKNLIMMELALTSKNIPFESHIYSYGGHGYSTAEGWLCMSSTSTRLSNWVSESIGWLEEVLGKLTAKGISEPIKAISMNADTSPVLSIECSLGHILKQATEVQTLLRPLYDGIRTVAEQRGYSVVGIQTALSANTIREIMEMVLFDGDLIISIDKELHKIVNKFDIS